MKRRVFLITILCLMMAVLAVVFLKRQPESIAPVSEEVEDLSQYDPMADLRRQEAERKAHYEANIAQYPTTPEKLLELVNSERAKASVAPLRLDERLNHSASLKVADMEKYDYNEHVNHDGTQGYELIFQQANECQWGGENITSSAKYRTAKDIVDSYMISKAGHREAILDPRYDLIGFHTEYGRNVMHFCDLP